MVELSVLRDLIAIFGVIAGFSYYVLSVKNAQRTRELQLKAQEQTIETRKIAIYNNYVDKITTKDFITSYLNLMYNQEWKNYDEWWEKYGANNPEAYNDFLFVTLWFQNLGMLYEQGVIEIDMLYYDRGFGYIRMWERLEPIIKVYRKQFNQFAYHHLEKLYHELVKFEKTMEKSFPLS